MRPDADVNRPLRYLPVVSGVEKALPWPGPNRLGELNLIASANRKKIWKKYRKFRIVVLRQEVVYCNHTPEAAGESWPFPLI